MIIVLIILLVCVSCDSTYRAAIAQLQEMFNPVEMFIPMIQEAKKLDVDILVFPEAGVHESFPEKIDIGSTPCGNSDGQPVQSNISCATKSSQIYVVFDMIEMGEKCEHGVEYCDDKYGYYIYNTAVVLDRKGSVVTKYRKHHPYTPGHKIFKPGPAIVSHFKSDFGVTFGLFICYDILWKVPAGDIVRKNKISNIVFPTHWVDTMWVDGSQVQQGYSEYYQVNLIAANDVSASHGSGIFSKGLPLVVNDEVINKLMVADVPIFPFIDPPEPGPVKSIPWYQNMDMKSFQASPSKQGTINAKLESHTCDFSFKVATGTENFSVGAVRAELGGIRTEACVFSNCGSSTPKWDCLNMKPLTTFEYLEVNITTIDDVRIVLPLVSLAGLKPIQKQFQDVQFVHNGDNHVVKLNQISDPVSFVVQFGLLNMD